MRLSSFGAILAFLMPPSCAFVLSPKVSSPQHPSRPTTHSKLSGRLVKFPQPSMPTSTNLLAELWDNTDQSGAQSATPRGPGAGVIQLKFKSIKPGGFKAWLTVFLLGQGKAADNERPFTIRESPQGGLRVLIGSEDAMSSHWDGVLDMSWGAEPEPFFRVDRIDFNEVIPYPGELYILNKVIDAMLDVKGDKDVRDEDRLFTFMEGDGQLAMMKGTLASLGSLG
ncbi:unnamed protein product [Discosporangium mesarthrocarpum]